MERNEDCYREAGIQAKWTGAWPWVAVTVEAAEEFDASMKRKVQDSPGDREPGRRGVKRRREVGNRGRSQVPDGSALGGWESPVSGGWGEGSHALDVRK